MKDFKLFNYSIKQFFMKLDHKEKNNKIKRVNSFCKNRTTSGVAS